MNVALLLWGGCFCLTAAFCLSMGNDHNREKRNWLLWMELSAAALLCCDAAAWFVQGTPGEASHLIMVATNFVVYAGLYLVLFLFNHYVGCYLREDGRLCAPKRSRAVDITCAVGIGLVFVSQFSPLLYYIDAQNIYHRSDAFPLSMVLLLIGMGTETTMMAQFYQKLTMGRRIAMFGCVVLPLSVAACQVFQDDISLISLSVGASMILLFVVATTADRSGRQPWAKAVSVMYFSTAPMVTAPKPSLSVQLPSHNRSCGHTRPHTSGNGLVEWHSSAASRMRSSCTSCSHCGMALCTGHFQLQ